MTLKTKTSNIYGKISYDCINVINNLVEIIYKRRLRYPNKLTT